MNICIEDCQMKLCSGLGSSTNSEPATKWMDKHPSEPSNEYRMYPVADLLQSSLIESYFLAPFGWFIPAVSNLLRPLDFIMMNLPT